MSNGGDYNVNVSTSWFTLQGPGMFIVVVLLVLAVIYNNIQTQDTIKDTQDDHKEIVRALGEVTRGLDRVFVSTLVTPEAKKNLPPLVQEKLQEKLERQATEKAMAPKQ